MKKRDFIRHLGSAAVGLPFLSFDIPNKKSETFKPYPTNDEAFWKRIRADYTLKEQYINLENGYYNIIPNPTLEKFTEHVKMVNKEGAYYMRTVQWDNKKKMASKLANFVGCKSNELIITRNATESLDMIIAGFPWKEGDEAIYALQDYGSMVDMFEQVAKRHGIVNKVVSVPNHPKSDRELVALYEEQITPKTKLLFVSHMINITGHILPIRKICDMAHSYGVDVLVDGAHCIGHFDINISELNCDYYGSSLHKWLSTPLGVGMLYINEEKISKIWSLLAEHERDPGDITRLNHTGTHPVHSDLAIENALEYLNLIGIQRKEKRMRFLQRYWSDQLREVKNIVVNTPINEQRSCGIGNVGIAGLEPTELAKILLNEFQIYTVGVNWKNVVGCRITPNVYTTTKELDHFVSSMKTIAARV
ncbi:selenocysteine lyase/cysteine desulfurase [Saonia flava]|uniref:Selenocysteine lyase/cysteine desulfurase n=1 Tax=Saonia flava TaxID=523696 RepID=A0A846QWV5_9FLAO|nr:aminotransferase class V-fold PLP-dependent enzyme [Saonia flava]NJB70085.1 selenocysteine lyase/cysteine desulfurase [Saonia flava]